jgi:hypothetical protein
MRNQYKVLSEKYNQVSEETGAEREFNTNSTVKMVKDRAKKYVEAFYNADSNNIADLLQAQKENDKFIDKFRGYLVPLEKPQKRGDLGAAIDLLYEFIDRNIEDLTNSKITFNTDYTTSPRNEGGPPVTPADHIKIMMRNCIFYGLALARGYLGDKIAVPYLRDADKILIKSIKNWLNLKQAATSLQQGSDTANVKLDI